MLLAVTAFYAGLMALWLVALGFEVSRRRRRHDVSYGDGGVAELEQAVRAHANACEYVPIALIVMGLAEGMGAPGWLLHLAGLMLVAGRGMHGAYFLAGARRFRLRFTGMMLTVVMIGGLGLALVLQALLALF
ncbi:MAG TPA: MAPEG family protein [Thermohalobaculum sp.]|nr:MAPEG family protein [Thermohalobaculum sp.]